MNTNTHPVCPYCGGPIPNAETPGLYPGATSRRDNVTEICSACGTGEAFAGIQRPQFHPGEENHWRAAIATAATRTAG